MRRTPTALALTAALLACDAQAKAGFDPGDLALQFDGSARQLDTSDNAILRIDTTARYFLNSVLELSVNQDLRYVLVHDAADYWEGSTTGYANYNFAGTDEAFVPFAGVFSRVAYGGEDTSSTFGPNVGFTQFITDDTYTMVRYSYEMPLHAGKTEGDAPTEPADSHVWSVAVGVKF